MDDPLWRTIVPHAADAEFIALSRVAVGNMHNVAAKSVVVNAIPYLRREA
jgi:hypothetical protein